MLSRNPKAREDRTDAGNNDEQQCGSVSLLYEPNDVVDGESSSPTHRVLTAMVADYDATAAAPRPRRLACSHAVGSAAALPITNTDEGEQDV